MFTLITEIMDWFLQFFKHSNEARQLTNKELSSLLYEIQAPDETKIILMEAADRLVDIELTAYEFSQN